MRRCFNKYFFNLVILIILSMMLVSCGAVEDNDNTETTYDTFLDDPNYYLPGDSVRGGDFSFIDVTLDAYAWDSEAGEYVELETGSYLAPGTHRIAVRADNRRDPSILTKTYGGLSDLIEGKAMDQRVYLSDGGCTYLVEAFFDEKSGYYVCDYNVSGDYPMQSLLIEIIYRDGMAKKEKINLSTRENLRAPTNELVKDGLILGVNTDWIVRDAAPWLLGGQGRPGQPELIGFVIGAVNYIFCDAILVNVADRLVQWALGVDMLWDYVVPFLLAVVDAAPGTTEDDALLTATLNFDGANNIGTINIDVDDEFQDGDTLEGGLAVSAGVSLFGSRGIMFKRIVDAVARTLIDAYSEPISLDLDKLLAPIQDEFFDVILDVVDIKIDYARKMVTDVFDHILPTNLTVYGHVFSRPEENTEDLLFVYISGFLTDSRKLPSRDDLALAGRCLPEWPAKTIMNDSKRVDLTPLKEMDLYDEVGIAVSGYMINSLMGQAGETFTINAGPSVVNFLFSLLPSLKSNYSSQLSGKIEFNSNSLTFDFHESSDPVTLTFMIQDLRFTLLDNDAPVTVLSMDVVLEMSIGFVWENGSWIADIGLSVVPEKSNIHLYEDKIGLTFIDHSNFLKALVDIVLIGHAMEADERSEIHWKADFTEILGVYPDPAGTKFFSKNGDVYLTLGLNLENEKLLNWDVLGHWLNAAFQL